MDKATPVELRRSLELVEAMKKAGIGFIPIPILNEKDRLELYSMLNDRLCKIEKESENVSRT